MATQSTFYTPDGSSLSYPQTKHIPSKQYVRVFLLVASTNTWVGLNESEYDLVYNNIVLRDYVNPITYGGIEVRIADSQNELADSLSEVAIVASIASEITTLSSVSSDITTVAGVAGSIPTVANNSVDISTVASNVGDVNIVADAINGGGSLPTSGGQFLGEGLIKAVQYMAQSTSSNIVVASGLNAFSVDSLTIEDGGSITIEDGATYKIL